MLVSPSRAEVFLLASWFKNYRFWLKLPVYKSFVQFITDYLCLRTGVLVSVLTPAEVGLIAHHQFVLTICPN